MPRSTRQVPAVYFGRPGALVQLPWPLGDLDKTYEKITYDFVSGGGQHTVQSLPLGSRPFTLSWNALGIETYAKVAQYWEGAMGVGPWAFIDPSSPNMLLPNLASATNHRYDVTGFDTSTNAADMGSLFSSTTLVHRAGAQRALRWQFTVTAATQPLLRLATPYRNWAGYPVVPGLPYTWSLWASADGVVDTSITTSAVLQWRTADGTYISEAASANTAVTGWQRLTATGTAPGNAVFATPRVAVTGSTVIVGGSLYLDELLLEQDSVANDWAPGTGTRPVEIMGLNDKVPFETRMRGAGVAMTLRELAA